MFLDFAKHGFTLSCMRYHHRLIEAKALEYWRNFPCVLLTGARQVGKSTMLAELLDEECATFVFDPVQDLYGTRADPDLFLRNNPPPLVLDEIQYVPELVPALKRYVDRHRRPGMFFITGSQQWQVMRRLSESLAGRVAILELPGFSLDEQRDAAEESVGWLNRWLAAASDSAEAGLAALRPLPSEGRSPAATIWRGSFPEVLELSESVVAGWMQGYLATYLQRDVRLQLEVRDEMQFTRFLSLCAALTAQECSFRQLGRDVGVSGPTAKQWLNVLRGTFQWLEIPAFWANHLKRLSEKPKGYFCDSGLACYLLRLSSPVAVQGHPAFGALFETFVATECFKQLQVQSLVPPLHHYRQHSGTEVDLIIEKDGRLFPVEIKASAQVRPADARAIAAFQARVGAAAAPGLVVYAGSETVRLNEACVAVPFDLQS